MPSIIGDDGFEIQFRDAHEVGLRSEGSVFGFSPTEWKRALKAKDVPSRGKRL